MAAELHPMTGHFRRCNSRLVLSRTTPICVKACAPCSNSSRIWRSRRIANGIRCRGTGATAGPVPGHYRNSTARALWNRAHRLSAASTAAVKILVLTAHNSEEYIRAALNAGADGYVLKDASRAELLQAIGPYSRDRLICVQRLPPGWVSGYLRPKAEESTLLSAEHVTAANARF